MSFIAAPMEISAGSIQAGNSLSHGSRKLASPGKAGGFLTDRQTSGTFKTMLLSDLITPEAVIPSLKVNTKKRALEELSDRAGAICGLPPREIFDALLQRERVGSTGIGEGIAIPHCRLAKAQAIFGIFARLARPIDFHAFDSIPVDLVCLLIAPESAGADHLKALACMARMLRDPKVTAKLRAARDVTALYALLTGEPASHAA